MIERGTEFNYDGKDWTVKDMVSVQYVNYQGYVVVVEAVYYDCFNDKEVVFIDLLANGTPLGYHK